MTDTELTTILVKSRENNLKKNITGMLLYAKGVFMQVLEGAEDVVNEIYEKIILDERHKNMIKLAIGTEDERIFSEWSMGFLALDPGKMTELESYFNPAKDKIINENINHRSVMVLKTFIENNNLHPDH